MLSDIEIAQSATVKRIDDIALKVGLSRDDILPYGHYKAKISERVFKRLKGGPRGKLILVTAINPTPAGEGKTTTSIGLADGMSKLGKKAVLALREPSLGPVFGVKGGAAGGGYSQVVPMEDINLHFTGDFHAVTSANNLLCALLDNHLQQGNPLNIDPRGVLIKRCLDMNDRALRNIIIGLGARIDGVPREDHFQITVASEIMAILCLADDLADLKARLSKMLVAYTYEGKAVFAGDLNAVGAMAALLKDAMLPNLVQTLENNPAIIHGGPFANIAHGCNSVRATKLALALGDYCITEAGFGSDLGAEKFFNIKCRAAGLSPACAVIVATVRALKYNGGVEKANLSKEDVGALEKGFANLKTHIENIKKFGVPVVVAINHFAADTQEEINVLKKLCEGLAVRVAVCEVFAKGGDGGVELAQMVCEAAQSDSSDFKPLYACEHSVKTKLEIIAREIYRANGVIYTAAAEKSLKQIETIIETGALATPLSVCVAKTQYSLSDEPTKTGAPENFFITVRDLKLSAGAGFVVAFTGDIMTLPGLPKIPAANNIDIDDAGNITGLF